MITSVKSAFIFASTFGSSISSNVHCVPSICEDSKASFLTYIEIKRSELGIRSIDVSSFASSILASTINEIISSSIVSSGDGGSFAGRKE